MKYIPLVLLISFFVGLYSLWFTIYYQVVMPLRQEVAALKTKTETEIIKNGKIFEIIGKY